MTLQLLPRTHLHRAHEDPTVLASARHMPRRQHGHAEHRTSLLGKLQSLNLEAREGRLQRTPGVIFDVDGSDVTYLWSKITLGVDTLALGDRWCPCFDCIVGTCGRRSNMTYLMSGVACVVITV